MNKKIVGIKGLTKNELCNTVLHPQVEQKLLVANIGIEILSVHPF